MTRRYSYLYSKKLKLFLYLKTIIFQQKERLKTCSIIVQKGENFEIILRIRYYILRCYVHVAS
ncbi:hypothetical protein T02_3934 [Trichinella nativa]|uniref:Uncharacterized protein n=1 Tax=Trichinella nativa TaxID=6335 RepID=A0A0V1KNJ2_9BILA|nr:hypothetical protein T02_3934 [Trichinella nativa]